MQLFHDYAFTHQGEVPRDNYLLGNVLRIQCKTLDYVRPVPFNHEKKKDIRVTIQVYKKDHREIYTCETERLIVPFSNILCPVELDFDPNLDGYSINEEDEEAIMALAKESSSMLNKRKTIKHNTLAGIESSFGLVRTEVQPQQSSNRRSQRTRTAVYCPHAFV